jgi:hypothetical protein
LERKAIINGGPGDISKKCPDGTTDLSFDGLPSAKWLLSRLIGCGEVSYGRGDRKKSVEATA